MDGRFVFAIKDDRNGSIVPQEGVKAADSAMIAGPCTFNVGFPRRSFKA